jgi:hypothetical protein
MMATAQSYYSGLTSGIPARDIQGWEADIADAEADRLSQRSKMDIMGTTKVTEAEPDAGKDVPADSRLLQALSLALSIEQGQ